MNHSKSNGRKSVATKLRLPRRSILRFGLVGSSLLAAPAVLSSCGMFKESLQTMIGQMLIIGFWGDKPGFKSEQSLKEHLKLGQAGGVLFLRHNAKTAEGVRALGKSFDGIEAPFKVLTAIDQEGGLVQRLGEDQGFMDIPTAQQLAKAGLDKTREILSKAAREMADAGFNMNLAPSVDFQAAGNPVIGKYGRGFGETPDEIEPFARAFIQEFENAGIRTVLKHFPGHGTTKGDSHDGFVDISSSWSKAETEPFRRLGDKASAIMTAHLFHKDYSDNGAPMSLSSKAVDGLLKSEMGFDGAIMTDDLDMAAVRKNYSIDEAMLLAVEAGSHILLASNSVEPRSDFAPFAVQTIAKAVDDGRIDAVQIEEAFDKVSALKSRF